MTAPEKKHFLLRLAFDGTHYHGFQVQKNAVTVCQILQDAMQKVFTVRPDVKGCSRTDAGVHAREFCVSFWAQTAIGEEKLPLALNSHLPPDIRVLSAQRVKADFHARYSAKGKEYIYTLLNSAVDDAFTPHLSYRVPGALDIDAMIEAAQYLLGRHDFASFMAAGSDIKDTVRTITCLQVQRRGVYVDITVAADGFLYNMVRIIAGTLLAVGRGRLAPQAMPGILAAKSRAAAGDTLPARGLFLNRVFYAE